MGIRRFCLLAVLVHFAFVPVSAMARGYGRSGGTINTPFGSMKMNSPEYKMAGGNPFVYQQLMQEKMLMMQQQMMLKQQQKYLQQMQKVAKTKKGKTADLQPARPVSTVTNLGPRKKKKTKPVTAVKSAAATAAASKAATIATSTGGAKASSENAGSKP